MDQTLPVSRRKFTLVEAAVILAVLGVLLALFLPTMRSKGSDKVRLADLTGVQNAVGKYAAEFGHYPTLPPPQGLDQPVVAPWGAGDLPSGSSQPAFAAIDFSASAAKAGQTELVRFVPGYLSQTPLHANEVAADGSFRWRIDSRGAVSVQMDGRSYRQRRLCAWA